MRALASQTLNQSGRLTERVRRFDQALARELTRVRDVFDARHTTALFLEVVQAGLENGRPALFIRRVEVAAGLRADTRSEDASWKLRGKRP